MFNRQVIRYFSFSARVNSAHIAKSRKTLLDIRAKYDTKQPISVVTSHDYITGKMTEKANVDITLIGDSLAMTTLGYDDTNELPFDEYLYHVKSVLRGNASSLLIGDLPFGSFEQSIDQAVASSTKLIKEGKIQGIKLEGGQPSIIPTVTKLIDIGIPVMGHVGLTPQKHNTFGGFKLQGTTVDNSLQIYQQCLNLQKAGAFAIVLECIPNKLAQFITDNLSIPTIGIGAGPYCSGQVLVIADMLGMMDPEDFHTAKFVKKYANFFDQGVTAIESYNRDLVDGGFPLEGEHGYKMKGDVLREFREKAMNLQ